MVYIESIYIVIEIDNFKRTVNPLHHLMADGNRFRVAEVAHENDRRVHSIRIIVDTLCKFYYIFFT